MITLYTNPEITLNRTISELPSSDEPATIVMAPGIYHERINLKRSNLTLKGDPDKETRITASEYALRIHEDGMKVGTFRTATFMADCDNFTAENITFENAAGQGTKAGQALALYVDGQKQRYINCKMLGYQDTIFIAPLPPKELQKNGFLGEKQFAPRRYCDVVFEGCRIEGNIDYIFGGGEALFSACTLFTRQRDREGVCYVTAASTPEGQKTGFVFKKCRFETDAPKGTVYLGRPWRNFAKTEVYDSYMDEGIAEGAWHDWNKPDAHETMFYSEGGNYGPGALVKRADFVNMVK